VFLKLVWRSFLAFRETCGMFPGMGLLITRGIGAPWLGAKVAMASLALAASVAAAQPASAHRTTPRTTARTRTGT